MPQSPVQSVLVGFVCTHVEDAVYLFDVCACVRYRTSLEVGVRIRIALGYTNTLNTCRCSPACGAQDTAVGVPARPCTQVSQAVSYRVYVRRV